MFGFVFRVWRNGTLGGAVALAGLALILQNATAQPLHWDSGTGFRSAALAIKPSTRVGFSATDPTATGLRFTNTLAQSRSLTNHVLLNGSGVAAGDVDGDGWCDLYFCGLDGTNVLYRNLGGWRFEDITAQAGVACEGLDATGAAFADVDGDGDLDLLVNTLGHGTHLFLNDGHGHFQDVTEQSGLASHSASLSMALADIDGDGALDLYVANYRAWTMRDSFSMRLKVNLVNGKRVVTQVNGRPTTDPDLLGRFSIDPDGTLNENGEADALYHNDGHGHFTLVPFTEGAFLDEDGHKLAAPPFDWSLSAMFRDLNGDGAPDLYVCGDLASPDRMWINDGKGHFRAAPRLALRKTSWFSMGVDFADLNRDGRDDFMVTDMVSRSHVMRQVQISNHRPLFSPFGAVDNRLQVPRNTVFLNMGNGNYSEIAYFAGLDATEWSWAPVFLDVDLDGYEDALIVTGFERDVQDIDVANRLEMVRRQQRLSDAEALRMRAQFPKLDQPKLAFRNRHDLTFEDVSAAWGFHSKAISQGMALADLDNDGDLDLVINDLNGPAEVFENVTSAPRVAIRLRGLPPNTRGIGARLRLYGGAAPEQSQQMISGGRYLSCDDAMRVFAAGSLTNVMRIEVDWRSGRKSVIDHVQANRVYEVDEATTAPPGSPHSDGVLAVTSPAANGPAQAPLFRDVSELLNHRHHDEEFDDFARQPLLPRKLSQLGPGVAWADLDGDGKDDLVIGSGRGGPLSAFRNTGTGFTPFSNPIYRQPVTRDQTGIVVGQSAPGAPVILAGSANYEDGLPIGSCVRQFDPGQNRVDDSLPGSQSSTGPLALADIDGDGDLDLFVGGRVVAGRYPEPASSRLFRNESGHLVLDADASHAFEKIGLVSGAVFTDLDGDGYPELVLACEWGPIRVFHNEGGRQFREITQQLGLDHYRGWWNGVAAGDFDGDGRMDLVASNWGENTKYQAYAQEPLRIYYGDFQGGGGVNVLEAYYAPELRKVVPWDHFGTVGTAWPFIRGRFSSFAQFGQASVLEILGDQAVHAQELQANWLPSTIFLNRGGTFEARALPTLAQLSPAFAVCVGDLNGDGNDDVFLSQNFFETEAETARYDSGYGVCLLGDGKGGFAPMLPGESGIWAYGDQRGAALADFDGDGRLDLVLAQNASETKLYRNANARPGVRIRLHGPAGNPTGVGAQVRMMQGNWAGAAHEVHAGSGYWSQDSPVLVVARPPAGASVQIRWPGGKTAQAPLPAEANEVEIDFNGIARRLR